MTHLLCERALLVRPTFSLWSGEITDRAASAATAEQAGAEHRAVRTLKRLVPKAAIEPIEAQVGAMRKFVRLETLPWRWDGVSLLPTDNYMHFTDGWREQRLTFDRLVHSFLDRYHLHVAVGQRSLGTLAHDYDYPSREEVARRFHVGVEMFPVPAADDFRATIAEDEASMIRAELEDRADAQLREAQAFLWHELQEHVGRIVERLSAYGKDEDGKVVGKFRDTLIGNLRSLCERLSRLNLTRDPQLETMRQDLLSRLCAHEPDELRQDDALRTSVRDEASRLMEQLQGFYPTAEAA